MSTTSQPGLNPSAIEAMFTRLMLTPSVYQEVRTAIKPEFFTASELHLRLLWTALGNVWDRYQRFDYHTVRDTCLLQLTQLRQQLPPVMYDGLFNEPAGLLHWTFYAGNSAANQVAPLARDLVTQFVNERGLYLPLRAALASVNPAAPGELRDMLAAAQLRQREMSAVDIVPVYSAAPEPTDEPALRMESTGLAFMDVWMGGGDAPGEVYGIIGPTGGGKTMLGVTLAVAKARVKQGLADEIVAVGGEPPPRPIVYFVTYEQAYRELWPRLMANAAYIPTETLARVRDPQLELTTAAAANWHQYELDMFALRYPQQQEFVVRPGEQERRNEAIALLREGVAVIDLSGTDPETSRPGTGFVEEVGTLISIDQQRRGNPGVALVVVDYALLAVDRYVSTLKGANDSAMRQYIGRYVDGLRLQVAGPFKTPIWILQQANAKGNTAQSTAVNSMGTAAEGFAFNRPLSFCVTLGTKDRHTSCVILSFEKRRRTGDSLLPTVLFNNGRYATMEDGSDRFVVDVARRQIVPIALGRSMLSAQAAPTMPAMTQTGQSAAALAAGYM